MSEIEWLFYHLWTKPHNMSINANDPSEFQMLKDKRKNMEVIRFPFKIPETIIYKKGKVETWYFRAKESLILK